MQILTIIHTKENVYDIIQMERNSINTIIENKICKEISILEHENSWKSRIKMIAFVIPW